ncbi:MAG TPA: DUF433 domain-containing protein [Verrucomicrobiae bacterium]
MPRRRVEAVERAPGKMSGAWVFKGARIPVAALFETLESGAAADDFLEWFQGVAREQVEDVLRRANSWLAGWPCGPDCSFL